MPEPLGMTSGPPRLIRTASPSARQKEPAKPDALLLCSLLDVPSAAADEFSSIVPPVAGRPLNFSGAVGSFDIQTRATPTSLQAEEPLIFTVRIFGTGSLRELARPDLRKLPSF